MEPSNFSRKRETGIMRAVNRVTRLDEFSPNGQLFTSSRFLKITKGDQMFGLLLSTKTYVFIFVNNRLGYILGGFFTSSSGHHGRQSYIHREHPQFFVEKN
jgi:hypothetical protein